MLHRDHTAALEVSILLPLVTLYGHRSNQYKLITQFYTVLIGDRTRTLTLLRVGSRHLNPLCQQGNFHLGSRHLNPLCQQGDFHSNLICDIHYSKLLCSTQLIHHCNNNFGDLYSSHILESARLLFIFNLKIHTVLL